MKPVKIPADYDGTQSRRLFTDWSFGLLVAPGAPA